MTTEATAMGVLAGANSTPPGGPSRLQDWLLSVAVGGTGLGAAAYFGSQQRWSEAGLSLGAGVVLFVLMRVWRFTSLVKKHLAARIDSESDRFAQRLVDGSMRLLYRIWTTLIPTYERKYRRHIDFKVRRYRTQGLKQLPLRLHLQENDGSSRSSNKPDADAAAWRRAGALKAPDIFGASSRGKRRSAVSRSSLDPGRVKPLCSNT